MQPINFIKTVSPQEQRSLRLWYAATLTLLILLAIGISIFQGMQLIQLSNAHTEHKQLQQQHILDQPLLSELQALEARTTKLQTHLETVTQRVSKQQRVVTHLKTVKKLLHEKALESYISTPHNLDITFNASSPQAATTTLQLIKQHIPEVQELRLLSLQPHKQGAQAYYSAHITGKIA